MKNDKSRPLLRRFGQNISWMKTAVFTVCAALFASLCGCASQKQFIIETKKTREKAANLARQEKQNNDLSALTELSVEDAIKLALENNRELQGVRLERDISRGRVLESYGQALPRVSAGASYTRLDEASRMNIGGQSTEVGFVDNYSADITVRQPLFRGGAISAALRAAKIYELLSDETIRNAAQNVIFQTAKDYYDTLLAQEMLNVSRQTLSFAAAMLEDVKRKRANGTASDYDVLRAEVEVSNSRAEMIRQTNALNMASSRFLKTIGLSQETRFSLKSKLDYKMENISEDEALRTALLNRPELYQAEYAVQMQREALIAARSAYWPKIDAFLTQKWANPDPHSSMSDEWGDAWLAGITATFSIFDGFERRGKVVQEKARLEQALTKLAERQESVTLEVKQAVLSLKDAEELVESQKLNLQRAEEGLRLVQAGYREGINSEVSVMDAQTALSRTRALYYQALHNHTVAKLNLQRAMGILVPERPYPEAEKFGKETADKTFNETKENENAPK